MENYIVINGKKAELTKEQMKQLGLIKDSPFDRVKDEFIYMIDYDGELFIVKDTFSGVLANKGLAVGNYCRDKELLQQRAWHETLERLLWRFSCENGGLDIDWDKLAQTKYYIAYMEDNGDFKVCEVHYTHAAGVYFISREIAEKAITEVVHPFIAKHPDFRW